MGCRFSKSDTQSTHYLNGILPNQDVVEVIHEVDYDGEEEEEEDEEEEEEEFNSDDSGYELLEVKEHSVEPSDVIAKLGGMSTQQQVKERCMNYMREVASLYESHKKTESFQPNMMRDTISKLDRGCKLIFEMSIFNNQSPDGLNELAALIKTNKDLATYSNKLWSQWMEPRHNSNNSYVKRS